MSVKELIKTAMNKDATEFEAKFNDIMADKMTSAIENKYTDMFQPELVTLLALLSIHLVHFSKFRALLCCTNVMDNVECSFWRSLLRRNFACGIPHAHVGK